MQDFAVWSLRVRFLVWGFGLLSSLFRFSAFLGSLLRVGLGFRVAIRSLGLEGAWVIVTVCVWLDDTLFRLVAC